MHHTWYAVTFLTSIAAGHIVGKIDDAFHVYIRDLHVHSTWGTSLEPAAECVCDTLQVSYGHWLTQIPSTVAYYA